MKSEIIAIGDEVVKGHTINSNAAYIARAVEPLGIDICYHTAVCDDEEAIKEVIIKALERSECVFVIGGLGPTKDDLTKEVVCKVLNQELICYEEILEKIQAYFKQTNRHTPNNNNKQALFPKGCFILENDFGTAPGCILFDGTRKIILLPGPPRELKPMLQNKVIPYFANQIRDYYETLDIKMFGIGESHLAEKMEDLLGVFDNYSMATYVGNNEIIVRIRVREKNREDVATNLNILKEKVSSRLKEYIIGYNDSQIEEYVLEQLKNRNYSIATAESCTGGLLAGTLINSSGISDLLTESIITYSNEAKMKYLDVDEETLKQHGAVSYQIAEEMARGIQKQCGADVGLSTTGIAGPGGGTLEKPVGTVYIGIAIGDKCYTYKLQLTGSRQEIRQKTVKHILYYLIKLLNEDYTCKS